MATPHDDDAPPAHDDITADLDLVDRLDREATPGPWEVCDSADARSKGYVRPCGPDAMREDGSRPSVCRINPTGHGAQTRRANEKLIAAARTLLPRLARALRARMGGIDQGTHERIVHDLNEQIGRLESAERDAYARGRREAIEEAATFLRAWAAACRADQETADDAVTLEEAARGLTEREASRAVSK